MDNFELRTLEIVIKIVYRSVQKPRHILISDMYTQLRTPFAPPQPESAAAVASPFEISDY